MAVPTTNVEDFRVFAGGQQRNQEFAKDNVGAREEFGPVRGHRVVRANFGVPGVYSVLIVAHDRQVYLRFWSSVPRQGL